MRILVVTKDIGGGFNTLYPVVKSLREKQYEVNVVAEGGSLDKWIGAGEKVLPASFLEEEAFNNDMVRPDAVIAELASPVNLARYACVAANVHGTPLIFIEDLWGYMRAPKRWQFIRSSLNSSVLLTGLAQIWLGVIMRVNLRQKLLLRVILQWTLW